MLHTSTHTCILYKLAVTIGVFNEIPVVLYIIPSMGSTMCDTLGVVLACCYHQIIIMNSTFCAVYMYGAGDKFDYGIFVYEYFRPLVHGVLSSMLLYSSSFVTAEIGFLSSWITHYMLWSCIDSYVQHALRKQLGWFLPFTRALLVELLYMYMYICTVHVPQEAILCYWTYNGVYLQCCRCVWIRCIKLAHNNVDMLLSVFLGVHFRMPE